MLKRWRRAAGTEHRFVVSLPVSTVGALLPMLLAFAAPYCSPCDAASGLSDDIVFALCLLLGVVLGAIYSFAASLGALIGLALLLAWASTLPSRGDAGMGAFMWGVCIIKFFFGAVAAALLRTIAKLAIGPRSE